MKTKVYKIEILVVDHDAVGGDEIRSIIEDARYPNDCLSPQVKSVQVREVDWSDDHPLNKHATTDAAYAALFAPARTLTVENGVVYETRPKSP